MPAAPNETLVENPHLRKNWEHPFSPRFIDFWLLGGASILLWVCLMAAEFFRENNSFLNQKFQSIPITFGLLALICNHPHFMASYKLAYSKPWTYQRNHWFVLLVVPLILMGFFAFAFIYSSESADLSWMEVPNRALAAIGLGFRFGQSQNLGMEFLGLSVWAMNLTVGWHYAKQVFGCAFVYSVYDSYPLNLWQRRALKFCLYSVAFYSFCHISFHWKDYAGQYGSAYQYNGLPMTELGLPPLIETITTLLVLFGIALGLTLIVGKNYLKLGKWPSLNFITPVVAFYIWWIPVVHQKEFYFMMVPFFHSLQYLPFALRMEKFSLKNSSNPERKFSFHLILILLAGFLSFEFIPHLLDTNINNNFGSIPVFFGIAFLVFINIHHFFIDSILWRSKDSEFRESILHHSDPRQKL